MLLRFSGMWAGKASLAEGPARRVSFSELLDGGIHCCGALCAYYGCIASASRVPHSRALCVSLSRSGPWVANTMKRCGFSSWRYPERSRPLMIADVDPPGDHHNLVSNAAERPRPTGRASSHDRIDGWERSGGLGDRSGVSPKGLVHDHGPHRIYLVDAS